MALRPRRCDPLVAPLPNRCDQQVLPAVAQIGLGLIRDPDPSVLVGQPLQQALGSPLQGPARQNLSQMARSRQIGIGVDPHVHTVPQGLIHQLQHRIHLFPVLSTHRLQVGKLNRDPCLPPQVESFLHSLKDMKLVVPQMGGVEGAVSVDHFTETDQLGEIPVAAGGFVQAGGEPDRSLLQAGGQPPLHSAPLRRIQRGRLDPADVGPESGVSGKSRHVSAAADVLEVVKVGRRIGPGPRAPPLEQVETGNQLLRRQLGKQGKPAVADHLGGHPLQDLVGAVFQHLQVAVAVHIDETGRDSEPGAVHHLHVRGGGDRTHLPDSAAMDQDRCLPAGAAAAIHHPSLGQENHRGLLLSA